MMVVVMIFLMALVIIMVRNTELTQDLRTSIDAVCDAWNVNPSDYIRRAVAHNVQSDLSQIENGETKIVFV